MRFRGAAMTDLHGRAPDRHALRVLNTRMAADAAAIARIIVRSLVDGAGSGAVGGEGAGTETASYVAAAIFMTVRS